MTMNANFQTADAVAADKNLVSIRNVTKVFETRKGPATALDNVSLDVKAGEVLVLLGPSGCGKTTLLRCVAGLEFPTSGQIDVHGNTVFCSERKIGLPPEKRNLSMVFQSYALWPHMSVRDNIGYPLKVSKVAREEIAARVDRILDVTALSKFADSFPGQLSGGQQQRVALARALVANDGLILFDEPLSNLDAKVRERLRDELLEMQQEFGFTGIYVTHDQVEAAALAHRIAVMEVGKIAQLGDPVTIFNRPQTPYVADFVGCANRIEGVVSAQSGGFVHVETDLGTVVARAEDHSPRPGAPALVMLRPEIARLVGPAESGPNTFDAEVERSIFLGTHVENQLRLGGLRFSVRSMKGEMLAPDTKVRVAFDPMAAGVFARP